METKKGFVAIGIYTFVSCSGSGIVFIYIYIYNTHIYILYICIEFFVFLVLPFGTQLQNGRLSPAQPNENVSWLSENQRRPSSFLTGTASVFHYTIQKTFHGAL